VTLHVAAAPPLGFSVQLDGETAPPSLAETETTPLGETAFALVSVTVAAQVVCAPTCKELGVQLTAVLVECGRAGPGWST
jgi:hypothetical protein